jgi:hypothetical protein
MKINVLKYNLVTAFILIAISNGVFAQKKVDEAGVIVIASRKIPPAYRLTDSPKIIDSIAPQSQVQYPLLSLKYENTIEIDTIDAATIKLVDKLPRLYNTYAKVGIGSTLMPLGEIYYNNGRSRKYSYGASLKHLSSFGKLKNLAPARFDRTAFDLYGAINEKKYTATADFLVNSRGLHWYGFEKPDADRDSIQNRFTEIGTKLAFASHKKDSASLNYKIGFDYSNFHDKKSKVDSLANWHGKENYLAVKSSFWYKWGQEIFAADFNIRYNGYKFGELDKTINGIDSGIVRNNTVVNLKPTVTTYAFNNKLKAQVGFDFTIDGKQKTKAYIYPLAEVKYSLFDDILIPYAGLKGGLKQNTFKSLSMENEFILSAVEIENEHNAITLFGGIKGTLTKQIGFNASFSFANYKNKAMFITDTLVALERNQFRMLYDTMNITTLEGSIYYQMSEKIKVDVIGRFNSYSARNNSFAWNLPQIEIIVRGNYNLYDKFLVTLDMKYEGGRRGLVYEDGKDVSLEDGQYAKKLGFIADVNLGVEYRYNKRISAFVQFNNVAAQRYQRWYNYPVQSFQVMGGFTFRF